MSDISKVISRVIHLRKLSEGNANIHEARAAAAAADRLIQEYRLSQAELECSGKEPQEPMHKAVMHEGGRRTAWRETLARSICNHYGCSWYIFRSNLNRSLNYIVVGRQSDTEIASYMFEWLSAEIERLCKFYSKGMGVRFAKSWLDGAAEGVADTFRQRKQEMQNQPSSSAMVLLDNRIKESNEFMRQSNPNMQSSKAIRGGSSYSARVSGYNVGKNIQIREGLSGKRNAELK